VTHIVVPATVRELVRRHAAQTGWTMDKLDTKTLDQFTRETGEELLASYRGDYPSTELVAVYNHFIENGEIIERHLVTTTPLSRALYLAACLWLMERHDPKPKIPFTADTKGEVTR
jgi:hypothetical protein